MTLQTHNSFHVSFIVAILADNTLIQATVIVLFRQSKADKSSVPKRSEQMSQKTVELSQQEASRLAVERAHIEQVFVVTLNTTIA